MKVLAIKAEPIRGRDLQPGDLFSGLGQPYWDGVLLRADTPGPIGERCYIRTASPFREASDADAEVYRLTIKVVEVNYEGEG